MLTEQRMFVLLLVAPERVSAMGRMPAAGEINAYRGFCHMIKFPTQ